MAAADPTVVWSFGSHAHPFSLPRRAADCMDVPPQPEGDGCDATLQWWFDQLDKPAKPAAPYQPPPPPAACRSILDGP